MIRPIVSYLASARLLRWSLMLCLFGLSSSGFSFQLYQDDFNAHYGTAGTRIDSCGLCHFNFAGGGPRTLYGEDYRNNNYSAANIGSIDSDGDGFTNDEEAALGTLTFPSLSCGDLANVISAPADIADYVNPGNPGCLAAGQPPVANMNGPYVAINGQPITFSSAGSFDPDGVIVSYLWNFGAGYGTSPQPNPTITYDIGFEARVLVTLTVTDDSGNSTTESIFVPILNAPNSPPTAVATGPGTGVANTPVSFTALGSSDPEGANLTYNWDFGDGSAVAAFAPSHTYTRCGAYTATLTVTDNYGLQGTDTTVVNVSSSGVDAPTAVITGDTAGNVGANLQFDGSNSSDPDCDIVSYQWNFGDGATATGPSPLHNYASGGSYVVSLVVTDND